MSHGTIFRLLKKSRVQPEPLLFEHIVEESKSKEDEFSIRSKEMGHPHHGKFVNPGRNDFDLVSFMDNSYYNVVSTMTFSSIFDDVRTVMEEEFEMDAYVPWKSQMVVDENLACEMLVAANYVLLEHYDRKIEDLMENRFIEPFGKLSPEYSRYSYQLMFPNDKEETAYDNYKSMLIELRGLLTVFLNSEEKKNYVLLLEIW